MSDCVSVDPDRLEQAARRLEELRDTLAAHARTITSVTAEYARQGGTVPGLARLLAQAQARSVTDAGSMRARAQLARRLADTPVSLAGPDDRGSRDGGAMLSIPWDMNLVDRHAALADAADLRAAMKSADPAERTAEIRQVEQDITDHLAEGRGGLGYLSAFYNQAAPQVAGLAAALYSRDGSIRQPLTARDQRTLRTFASGLAYVLRNGAHGAALSRQAMRALTHAPDMWSVAMLVKYGPGTQAYGTGPGSRGAELLRAVQTATVQIGPHVIVPADDPAVPGLRAAWAWAAKRHIMLASTAGDVEYTRWAEIAAISPYRDLLTGQLHQELGSITPDSRICGAFNKKEKVLITTAGTGAVVFFNDPKSLLGAAPEQVEKLVPPDWTGPRPLKTGMPGWRYFDGKGRSVTYEEGDPSAPDFGVPDSLLHHGPYFRITENGYEYRIAAPGNPAFDDPDAATFSMKMPDRTKIYLKEPTPTDDPADGDGGGTADGAAPGGGAGDEATGGG